MSTLLREKGGAITPVPAEPGAALPTPIVRGQESDLAELSALRAVPPPRATRKLAIAMVALFATLPIVLLLVPWQQNVSSSGRVTAFHPLDRTQVIPAPVTGRLVDLQVQEGDFVEKGQRLAEMADLDPDYAMRLQRQVQLAEEKLTAAQGMVEGYDQQLVYLEEAREEAISEAGFEVETAIEKVKAAEQDLYAAEAEYEQKLADRERKFTLWQKEFVSELDFQKAEASFLATKSKVEAAKAKVSQARNQESAKMAKLRKISSDQRAKIESTKSAREDARQKVSLSDKEVNEANTKLDRQRTQVITAPRAGTVLRVHAASSSDLLSRGEPLIELIPATDELAVELWVRGIDAPLVTQGRKVRLQFEGWPAVQFAGWPSVAVGTFGGEVAFVDAHGTAEGRFRILVTPDPDDEPWPERTYLRQGGRANGWVLLDEVSLGYEVWRQLNAFPPSVRTAPKAMGMGSENGSKSKSKGFDKDGGDK